MTIPRIPHAPMADAPPNPNDRAVLAETKRKVHTVLVPVFLQVELPADDEMEAEVSACDVVRGLNSIEVGEATVSFRTSIGPIVDRASASLS